MPVLRICDSARLAALTGAVRGALDDLDAPDPFALAAWRANRLPTDPQRMIWLMCSVLDLVYGWPFLEVLEVSVVYERGIVN